MFRWMWRSKLGPIRLLVLMLGKDLADINIDKEATYRMQVLPKNGAEHSKLIDVCKRIFQCSKEDAVDSINLWVKAKNGDIPVHPMELYSMFTLTGLSKDDVMEVRKICEKHKCFRVEYDELEALEREASWEAKQKILKRDTDALVKKQAKNSDPFSDQYDEEPEFFD